MTTFLCVRLIKKNILSRKSDFMGRCRYHFCLGTRESRLPSTTRSQSNVSSSLVGYQILFSSKIFPFTIHFHYPSSSRLQISQEDVNWTIFLQLFYGYTCCNKKKHQYYLSVTSEENGRRVNLINTLLGALEIVNPFPATRWQHWDT